MRLIYTTYPDQQSAQKLSEQIVSQRLAACANIFPAHQSLYWWDGKVQNESEVAVLYKTDETKLDVLKSYYIDHHPYDVPCFVALDITDGHAPFLEWISAQVK